MEKKWRVSDVELLEGGLLFGFALYDQKGTAVRFVRIPDQPKLMRAAEHRTEPVACKTTLPVSLKLASRRMLNSFAKSGALALMSASLS